MALKIKNQHIYELALTIINLEKTINGALADTTIWKLLEVMNETVCQVMRVRLYQATEIRIRRLSDECTQK